MKKLENCYFIDDVAEAVDAIKHMRKPTINSGFITNTPISSITYNEKVEEKTVTIDMCDFCRGDGSYANWGVFDDGFLEAMAGRTAKFVEGSKIETTLNVTIKTLIISCGEKKLSIMYTDELIGYGSALKRDIPVFAKKNNERYPNTLYIMESRYDKDVIGEIFDAASEHN